MMGLGGWTALVFLAIRQIWETKIASSGVLFKMQVLQRKVT